jgi:hypothetical protein
MDVSLHVTTQKGHTGDHTGMGKSSINGRTGISINTVTLTPNSTPTLFPTLVSATLKRVSLSKATLSSATFSGANLIGANLSDAFLRDADLIGANLVDADLSGAYLWETVFGDVDLSTVKGLEMMQHRGPSTIGIDTIYLSQDKIPEVFLKGAGVSDSFIDYMRSLVAKPIDYYSCFINYSSKDQAFAERLYADLQSNHVRCWFAPEDMKIGDEIRVRIDESIRVYDKLLLVLSEHSVESSWVEDEVEAALEKERLARERGERRMVLFPIQLDESMKIVTSGWPAKIRRARHIGDFTQWKQHDEYQKAFARLLRDLQAQ